MEIEKTVTRDNLIKGEISLSFCLYCKSQTTQCQEKYNNGYYKEKLQLCISHIILFEVQIEMAERFGHGKR